MILEDQPKYTFLDIINGKHSFKFPEGYLPKVVITGDDMYLESVARSFGPDGNDIVSYVLFDKCAQAIDDNVPLIQVIPHGFLAKLTVPQRNKIPDTMQLEYLIDMDAVNIETFVDESGDRYARFLPVEMEGDCVVRNGMKIPLDHRFATLSNPHSKMDIFKLFIPRN